MAVLNMLPDVEIRDWDVFTYFLNMVIKSIKYAYFALITINLNPCSLLQCVLVIWCV